MERFVEQNLGAEDHAQNQMTAVVFTGYYSRAELHYRPSLKAVRKQWVEQFCSYEQCPSIGLV